MKQPAMGEFCWNELATPDISKAKDFYGKVFGWQFEAHEMEEMSYTLVKSQDREFAGIWQIPKDQQEHIPPHWIAYILVADVAASLEKAKQYGAKEVKGVTKVGEFGCFAIITDPTGAHLALWESGNC
ncbi:MULTISPECIES: VOC family protein [unclassified Legionella]|uniref:VOC family protein n=1 Tax=unclassified Legionella TaxID=2622702 RepID=UPI0010562883|nr:MULTISPECIES: VOC family protein [unclassified Legionella]MDI9818292.1 VOC family protein [Legionella sp. PL877]